MCNLYRMTNTRSEVARLFGVGEGAPANQPELIFPGLPGLVVAGGEVQAMHWGFPLVLKGKQGQALKPRPVNNARSDKLDSPFWRASMERRRCLIPVSAYAEAEGPKGGKTRTWLSLPGEELFACAGLWRASEEWGRCYAMVITEASEAVRAVHHRMPVLLAREDWSRWLEAPAEEAVALCVPWGGAVDIERTGEKW